MITPTHDRSAEQPAEPCATHEIAAIFIVRAQVCEGTTLAHLIEYVTAQLANREPDLHEDIWDELETLPMQASGHELLRPAECGICDGTGHRLDNHEADCACKNEWRDAS